MWALVQATQIVPPVPHAMSLVPGWHVPPKIPSSPQHPVGHDSGVQPQKRSAAQSIPAGHATQADPAGQLEHVELPAPHAAGKVPG